jgi:hypothetical protein
MRAIAKFSGLAALMVLSGCASAPPGAESAVETPATCQRACNASYDSCMARFSGVTPGSALGGFPDNGNIRLDPNNVCPDQLKSCQRSCLN